MQWQMWTAFGIMVGYIADIAFYFVGNHVLAILCAIRLTK